MDATRRRDAIRDPHQSVTRLYPVREPTVSLAAGPNRTDGDAVSRRRVDLRVLWWPGRMAAYENSGLVVLVEVYVRSQAWLLGTEPSLSPPGATCVTQAPL
jgi:hypothetical protein